MSEQTLKESENERPVFVKSQNFRNSKIMKFPDDPPTDRQVKYLIRLGFKGDIPPNRKEASNEIEKLLREVGK